jgi:hypothetical protein
MIVCPSCRAEQIDGTLFCTECGTDLQGSVSPTWGLDNEPIPPVTESRFNTGNISPPNFMVAASPPIPEPPVLQHEATVAGPVRKDLKLIVLNTGRRIDCPDRNNIIIGRGDAITGEMPDVDLTPDDALELGVSRRHACITFREGQPYITDLGSTNRTFINRQVLMRGQPYSLKDGDEIRMGNAILKINYKPD